MSFRHPYPNVYKFCNQFAAADQPSPEHSSRSQGLRKSGPRSKTGCSTCKQRRVKCDEAKPGCVRCQNLSRPCGGYVPETSTTDTPVQEPTIAIHSRLFLLLGNTYSPSSAIPGTADERRYFHRFCDKTALEIAGSFDPTFWTEKVLRLCHSDAPIRHAVIALGALAESLELTSLPTRLSLSGFPQIDQHCLDEHHKYALRQYSKSISALRIILGDGRRHLRTSLTSCVLFMTFEAMQGCYEGALTHLRGGSRLLADWRTARRGQSCRLSQDSLSEIQDGLIDDLGRMFARLDVQGLFVPPPFPMPESDWEDVIISDSFSSVEESRESFDFLMQGIGQFYRKSVALAQTNPERLRTEGWVQQYNHYSTQLDQWRASFQAAFAKEVRKGGCRAESVDLLSIYSNVATVLLASSVEHEESLYDEYTELFQEIVIKARTLLSAPVSSSSSTSPSSTSPSSSCRFTLDMGTILPLLVTATKCRDRKVRRQAIALLWSKARREGLCYDTITVARLCAWLASIEGEGITDDDVRIEENKRYLVSYLHLSSEERWLAAQLTSAVANTGGDHTYRKTTFSW
ncbi:hypothetical protein LZ554_004333 [Drepanopeziza brunnea f. sp. 'monogermtubi']|nr:hypothetical protein LZ554_004333 [Drepanopeziza brunnea f. sp. 'monogermtubi']